MSSGQEMGNGAISSMMVWLWHSVKRWTIAWRNHLFNPTFVTPIMLHVNPPFTRFPEDTEIATTLRNPADLSSPNRTWIPRTQGDTPQHMEIATHTSEQKNTRNCERGSQSQPLRFLARRFFLATRHLERAWPEPGIYTNWN